ncbi:WAT1-related protein At5g64700-like isoform X2 [Panicum virgatum]|uniref:WAT1-related protein At5g64700-like isoform X2 n=1 Tax=Panicum virgatum TaxID=38727 RepID=UPI0019D59504|nr:WAT1-related protein At5g64700-like isoform X2 [Panicum virgatum]
MMDVETGARAAAPPAPEADVKTDASAAAAPPPPPEADADAAWKAPAAMVLVQLFNTGMVLLSKAAIGGGMFVLVLLAYRGIFGAVIILPLVLLLERGKWKEMDWRAAGWIFLNALIGMEALHIRTMAGSLKVAGVLLSVGGTMIISLYKGEILHLWNPILHLRSEEHVGVARHQLRGTFLLAGSTFMFACWYLIQSKILKVYPYKYWSSMATCLVGGFQTALAGVIVRRDVNAWKIGWDINLLTIVYSGALATAGKYSLNSWAVAKKGPSYPPMFMPLSVVFTVVLGSIFLGDDITVGSLIGTTLVIVGTYIFLWAKANELPKK